MSANIRRGRTVKIARSLRLTGGVLRPGGEGIPGDTVVTETAFGQASTAGTGQKYSREDHTHGTPATPSAGVTDAEYAVAALHSGLSAERVLTNTASVTWDFATAGQAKANAVAGVGGGTILADTFANRPAAGSAGRLFLSTNSPIISRDTGAAWQSWAMNFPVTEPVDGSFAWVNQGSATVDTTKGGIYLSGPATVAVDLHLRVETAPATPWTRTAMFLPKTYWVSTNRMGLVFRQSSDGKLHTFHPQMGFDLKSSKWNSATSFSADYLSVGMAMASYWSAAATWMRVEDDGANRNCYFSADGQHFILFHSIGRTDFLTADQVGFFVDSSDATLGAETWLLSWA